MKKKTVSAVSVAQQQELASVHLSSAKLIEQPEPPKELDVLEYNHPVDATQLAPISNIYSAYKRVRPIVTRTPLTKSVKFSDYFDANIYFKREDLQIVRSYKLRGAYNRIMAIPESERNKKVFCSSAGNHAQGVSYSCNLLKIYCVIYMPTSTPTQKYNAVMSWGKQFVKIILYGDTFDDSYKAALEQCNQEGGIFVHAFDDDMIIEGQGTIAVEVLEDFPGDKVDFMFFPVGGGGCGAGIVSYFKQMSPNTIQIGVEPEGSPSMFEAIKQQKIIQLDTINTFVDGAAIKKSGVRTFKILNSVLKGVTLVPEGHVCTIMMRLFNEEGILVEPAGALTVAALDQFKSVIKGKTVVCLISGSNNDIGRIKDIRMFSEIHKGHQYYLFVNFYQKPGAIKSFITNCLGPTDELTNLKYTEKNSRDKIPALVGIKVKHAEDFDEIKKKLDEQKITYKFLTPNMEVFKLLV